MKFLEYFNQIVKIPHCSTNTTKMAEFLLEFAKNQGFNANIDEFGNIHAIKGKPKICLQAHYDMVCVGNAPQICLKNDGKFLSAKNSTLGADNGIGVCIIMQMMNECKSLEVLFTNDEEIGLIGANGFKGEILSQNLLNLDSERDDEVIIGCAGGINALINIKFETTNKPTNLSNIYEIKCENLPGGHSGIEIAKNIPNAIQKLAFYLFENNCKLIHINAGERNNAIPTSATAIIQSQKELKNTEFISIKKLENAEFKNISKNSNGIIKNSKKILSLLASLPNGVLAWDNELNMPLTSINLAIVKQDKNSLNIELFGRSSDKKELEKLEIMLKAQATLANFSVEFSERSLPWKPQKSEFAKKVLEILQTYQKKARLNAIHAGLECGVLQAKMQEKGKILHACSIGPNINGAHTIHENCQISSAMLICNVVQKILKNF